MGNKIGKRIASKYERTTGRKRDPNPIQMDYDDFNAKYREFIAKRNIPAMNHIYRNDKVYKRNVSKTNRTNEPDSNA